jgi:hypothetical protein
MNMMPAAAQDRRPSEMPDRLLALEAAPPGAAAHPRPAPRAAVEDDRLLGGVFEVNERCLELLVHAARQEPKGSFRLVAELRELLKTSDPAIRRRAACRSFLLVDLEFGNSDWWRGAGSHLSQQARFPSWRGAFPRASGTRLARATLLLAWNSLRAARDPVAARLLLGMAPEVGDLIAGLRFDQIDRIAEKRLRFVRPRWDDRPAVWRRILLAARADDQKLMSEFNVYALQLLAGDLMLPTPPPE